MDPERWRRLEDLFHSALKIAPGKRTAHLAEVCDQDQQLRGELEALLRNAEDGTFLERHAIEIAAKQYGSAALPDLSGRKLGRYEVISGIGAGGMGQVYLAHDTRLNRHVALKVLRQGKLTEPERMRRFVQEARAASALNHSHIVTVHDIDQIQGIDFIAMEYVPGTGLDKIIRGKALSLAKLLHYAIQIADALATAHAAGIVHRDLKPSNIVIDDRDFVKIVDFGLAKLIEARSSDGSVSTERLLETTKGTIMGTVAYMSPEQTEGKALDARSDIFSFGAVLYEMSTGKPAFLRETVSATIAAILRDDPKPISQQKSKPARELESLIGRCLRRDPKRRFQSMAEVKTALEDLQQQFQAANPTFSLAARRWLYLLIPVAALLIAGLTFLLQRKPRRPHEITRLTFDGKLAWHPAISLDGKYLAYASNRGSNAVHIWVQELPTGEPVRLTKDEANEDYPSFSPDGRKIAFRSDRGAGGIYVTSLVGGEPKLLVQGAARPQYSPDGKLLLVGLSNQGSGASYSPLFLMPSDGGERRLIQTDTESWAYSYPVWSADGSELLYMGARLGHAELRIHWYILPVSGGKAVPIDIPGRFAHSSVDDAAPAPLIWFRDNRVLFSASSGDAVNLWSATLSPRKHQLTEPLDQLTFGPGNIDSAAGTSTGAVVFGSVAAQTRLWALPLQKGGTQSRGDPVSFPSRSEVDAWPSLSDTGKLAYLSARAGKWNLWLRDLPSGKETWLATAQGGFYNVSTLLNRAGSRVAYTSCDKANCAIFTVAPGGMPEKICDYCGQIRSMSLDGSVMLSATVVQKAWGLESRINRIDARRGRKAVVLEKRGSLLFSPDLSPDGRWIAFQRRFSLLDPFEQIFVAPVDTGSLVEPNRWIVVAGTRHFDANPVWSRSGNMLYFNSDRDGFTCLWAVRLDSVTKEPVGEPFALKHFHGNPQYYSNFPAFTVGADRIVISLEELQSDVWMMSEAGLRSGYFGSAVN